MIQAPRSVATSRGAARLPAPVASLTEAGRPAFEVALDTAHTRQLRDHLQGMLDRILTLSDRMSTSLSRGTLDDYREAVKQFLSQVIDRSVSLKRDALTGNLLSVRTVNAALARLGDLVVEREQDRLRILDEIGEIKGLLVSICV